MTYKEVLKEADLLLNNKAQSTKDSYMGTLEGFEDFPTRAVIVDKTEKWMAAGLKESSIAQKYSAIRWLFKHFPRCFDFADVQESTTYMSEIKIVTPKVSIAKPEQIEVLLQNASQRTALAIGLMYYHGLRVSDVTKLELSDFTETEHGTEMAFRDKKTKKPLTYILLPPVVELLHQYVNGERQGQRGTRKLFLGERGPLTKRSIQHDVTVLCDRFGMSDLHCHSFRHGCGTAYAKAGAGVEVIKAVLGHKNITSSQRYIHLAKEDIYEVSKGVF